MDYVRRHAMMIAIVAIVVFTLCFTGVFAGRWFFSASDGAHVVPEHISLAHGEAPLAPII
jgi:hypothetical protein